MILIGQFDSPFVRRVGVALRLYGLAFEHWPLSTFGDAEKLRERNPLLRVPTLMLDSGLELVESHIILFYLDGLVGPHKALMPNDEDERVAALRIIGLATGVSDKAVSLFYEKILHAAPSQAWIDRCMAQIVQTVKVLETERAQRTTTFLFGTSPTHADIAVAAMLDHMAEAHPGLLEMSGLPALRKHLDAMHSVPEFQEIYQRFIPPS